MLSNISPVIAHDNMTYVLPGFVEMFRTVPITLRALAAPGSEY